MTTVGRRSFLTAAAGTLVWAGLPGAARAERAARRLFSCGADNDGGYFAALFDTGGRIVHRFALPARGHGFAIRPRSNNVHRHATVFARRPGAFAIVADLQTGAEIAHIPAAPGRRFYGHGVYTPDGRTLFASENDYGRGTGVIGVYDAMSGYKRVGEFASHGVGPHEVVIHPDGKTLVVANGGIRTDPARGRAKLNLDTMQPNLALVDPATGRAVETARLDKALHQLSTRHIAVNRRGDIAIAMQFQGGKSRRVPMLALYKADGGMRPLRAPAAVERHLRHYMGSVAYDVSGRVIMASAPRGGLVVFWDNESEEYLGHVTAADACGVAPGARPGGFVVTAGDGSVRRIDGRTGAVSRTTPPSPTRHWDNHVGVAIG